MTRLLFEAEFAADQADVLLAVELDEVFLVLDQFQRTQHAEAARLADQRMLAQFAQALLQVGRGRFAHFLTMFSRCISRMLAIATAAQTG